MDFAAFASAFGLIFVAELGDKTQLAAMTLATRYPWQKIFLGIALAFVVLNLAAVTVGTLLFAWIPVLWLQLGTAVLFAGFGVASLRSRVDAGEQPAGGATGRPFVAAFLLILVAELGDKTQLATAGLAAQQGAPLEVFAGSSLALWSVSLLGIFLGRQLTRYMPLRWVHRAGGVLFLLFAALTVTQALA